MMLVAIKWYIMDCSINMQCLKEDSSNLCSLRKSVSEDFHKIHLHFAIHILPKPMQLMKK